MACCRGVRETVKKTVNTVGKAITRNKQIAPSDSQARIRLSNKSIISKEKQHIKNRYKICSMCEYLSHTLKIMGKDVFKSAVQCIECGCALELKIPIESMECPINKW